MLDAVAHARAQAAADVRLGATRDVYVEARIREAIQEPPDTRRAISDLLGEHHLRAWESGYNAAISIARSMGAVAVVAELERALDSYWRSQGIDPED